MKNKRPNKNQAAISKWRSLPGFPSSKFPALPFFDLSLSVAV
jgi:hypothetical protein